MHLSGPARGQYPRWKPAQSSDLLARESGQIVKSGACRVSKPVKLKAPITDVQKVLCVGMNYVEHCTEQNMVRT